MSKVYGHTNTGVEGRQGLINVNEKQGITCMATITAAGSSLKSYFVKKGTTDRCLSRMRARNISCVYSDNGWMTEATCINYINDIVLPHLNGSPGCLIWDIYAAHTTNKVKQHCDERNIKLIYVPASLTHKRQPLDTHIFGVIKQQYKIFYCTKVFFKNHNIEQIDSIQKFKNVVL